MNAYVLSRAHDLRRGFRAREPDFGAGSDGLHAHHYGYWLIVAAAAAWGMVLGVRMLDAVYWLGRRDQVRQHMGLQAEADRGA